MKLGYPTAVEACSTKLNPETYPLGVMAHFEFPARGEMPPLTLHWYDGLDHEICNEPEQGQVLADITAWLDQHRNNTARIGQTS